MRALQMLAALAAFTLAAPVHAQEPPSGERRHVGLIIGNSSYTGSQSLPALPNACSDAQNVAASLVRIGWKEDSEIDLHCNLTVDQMSAGVRKFVSKLIEDPYAVGVFYFAGHGVQVDERQFIFGVDAKPNLDVARRQIDRNPDSQLFVNSALDVYDDFIQVVGAVPDGGLTVIIDACRSDPLITSINRDGVRRVTAPTVKTTLLPGIMIALSTQNGELAMDGGGAIGPYADALRRAIARDKFVSSIMTEVTTKVWQDTKRRFPQRPQIPYFSGGPSFPCLAGCVNQTAMPAAPTPPADGPGLAAATPAGRTLFHKAAHSSDRAVQPAARPARGSPLLQAAQAPAGVPRVAPRLITPLFSRQTLANARQAKGLRVEIFWCEAGDDMDGRRMAAERYGQYLTERAQAHGEGHDIASVRLRVLTRNGNALPAYRFVQNAVLSDAANPIATKWAGIMAETKDLLRADAPKTGDYMAMFVCSIGAQTPYPAKVYWHVPNTAHVSLASSMISKLDERAGNFKSITEVQVIEAGPAATQIRYYHDADQIVAFRLADSLQVLLGHDVQVKYFSQKDTAVRPKAGTVEVWIGDTEPAGSTVLPAIVSSAPSRNRTIKQ